MEKKSEKVNQTPQEKRQQALAQLDATKQAITELSEDELEAVAGGGFWGSFNNVVDHSFAFAEGWFSK